MKNLMISTVLASTLLLSLPGLAKVEYPAPSPGAKIIQKVGLGTVEIDYSRPSLKGRKMLGEQVPYGKLWRTGANAPTTLTFSEAVTIEGQEVPAGRYSLFSIPSDKQWTVILNKDGDVKNDGAYDAKMDLARFTIEPVALKNKVETFTIGLDNLRDDSATLFLDWGNVRVPLQMKMDTKTSVMSQIKAQMFDNTPKSAGEYATAAYYYYNNGGDLEQALDWMNQAMDAGPTFYYAYRQALILAKLGRNQEARAAVKKSLEMVETVDNRREEYKFLNQQLLDSLK